MGYHIWATDKSGSQQIAFFHLNTNDKERLLHKALGVQTTGHPESVKEYSLGKLLDAKAYLNKISGTLDEQDFVDRCILEVRETRNPVIITFN